MAEEIKYHINPKTGVSSQCAAQVFCPFGDLESDHYPTRASAQKAFEKKYADSLGDFEIRGKKRVSMLKKKVLRHEGLDWDGIERGLDYINQWEEKWTPEEEANMALTHQIALIVERDPFTAKDRQEVEDLLEKMTPYEEKVRSGYDSNDNSWRARDKMIDYVARGLLTRRIADDITHEPAEALDNPRLLGLQEAQDFALNSYNRPTSAGYDGLYLGEVEPHFQEAIARVVRGDEALSHELLTGTDDRNLFTNPERIFNTLHPDSKVFVRQLYLASVFPVRELKEEMSRVDVDNVSVSTLDNGREWGNVYTVIKPDGGTRSFAVYEHRNSDSIIINGKDNWGGEDLPYAEDDKNRFFAEFDPNDRKRAAQALTFYMMQAQSGTLESDEALADKASKRDWNAILDAQIPGFKAWRQASIDDHYIAPIDENADETLARLDF